MSSSRPGGRSAANRAKVLAAARELVAAKGPQNVTMPEIAQRAGIAATSLYRRWGDLGSLLLDMAVERLGEMSPLPDEGSVAADLRAWSGRIADGLKTPGEAMFFRVLLATWDVAPDRRAMALLPRREQLEAMLARGRARGEAVPAIDEVMDHLLAPLYMRALVGLPVDRALAERLVERLLGA